MAAMQGLAAANAAAPSGANAPRMIIIVSPQMIETYEETKKYIGDLIEEHDKIIASIRPVMGTCTIYRGTNNRLTTREFRKYMEHKERAGKGNKSNNPHALNAEREIFDRPHPGHRIQSVCDTTFAAEIRKAYSRYDAEAKQYDAEKNKKPRTDAELNKFIKDLQDERELEIDRTIMHAMALGSRIGLIDLAIVMHMSHASHHIQPGQYGHWIRRTAPDNTIGSTLHKEQESVTSLLLKLKKCQQEIEVHIASMRNALEKPAALAKREASMAKAKR